MLKPDILTNVKLAFGFFMSSIFFYLYKSRALCGSINILGLRFFDKTLNNKSALKLFKSL